MTDALRILPAEDIKLASTAYQQTTPNRCAGGAEGAELPSEAPATSAAISLPHTSAVPQDWEFSNTPQGLMRCAEIATFALQNAYFRFISSEDTADREAAQIIRPFWYTAAEAYSFLVQIYCNVDTKKEWKRRQQRKAAEKKQAGAA